MKEGLCAICGRRFLARSANAKYCLKHRRRKKRRTALERMRYGWHHQQQRVAWRARVATGTVRCARGPACFRSELVEGVLVGGFIRPGEPWDLDHADDGSLRYLGPSHARCNRATNRRDDDSTPTTTRIW